MTTEERHDPDQNEHGPDPDMADVIEGPVGSSSIVDPETLPERDGTMPELGLADRVSTPEPTPID